MSRYLVLLALLTATACSDIAITDEGEPCESYCVGQQSYACNTDGVIVAAQICGGATVCLNGACVPLDGAEVTGEDATTGQDVGDEPDPGVEADPGTEPDTAPPVDAGEDAGGDDTAAPDADAGAPDTDAGCVPACDGKECGPDGCGGDCGTCPDNGSVCSAGQCACDPQASTICGPDGDVYWVDACGNAGPLAASCEDKGCEAGACLDCVADCALKECGGDGCGGSCGVCDTAGGYTCQGGSCLCTPNASSACTEGDVYWYDSCGNLGSLQADCQGFGCTGATCDSCTPTCGGKVCGPDGCGGICGTCDVAGGQSCESGSCVCTPNVGFQCVDGDVYWIDSCGQPGAVKEVCGGFGCASSACIECVPSCSGKECGSDGCNGSCGTCDVVNGESCDNGQCTCEPMTSFTCSGGDVYWMDSCGAIGDLKQSCNGNGCSGGVCLACSPDCVGKVCGDDGCGGSCGTCNGAQDTCNNAGQCECVPSCGGGGCGSDGCGGTCSCGKCQECSGGACSNVAPFSDPNGDCPGAQVCGYFGNCGMPPGTPCDAANPTYCASNACNDGFCCNVSCTSGCFTCGGPGMEGTCTYICPGTEPCCQQGGFDECLPAGLCPM